MNDFPITRRAVIAIICVCSVILIAMAIFFVRDLTADRAVPLYELTPPSGIARPQAGVSIIDANKVSRGVRFSDAQFLAIQREADAAFRLIGPLSANRRALVDRYGGGIADAIAGEMASAATQVPPGSRGRKQGVTVEVTDEGIVKVRVQMSYVAPASDEFEAPAQVGGVITLSYARKSAGQLSLSGVDIAIDR